MPEDVAIPPKKSLHLLPIVAVRTHRVPVQGPWHHPYGYLCLFLTWEGNSTRLLVRKMGSGALAETHLGRVGGCTKSSKSRRGESEQGPQWLCVGQPCLHSILCARETRAVCRQRCIERFGPAGPEGLAHGTVPTAGFAWRKLGVLESTVSVGEVRQWAFRR